MVPLEKSLKGRGSGDMSECQCNVSAASVIAWHGRLGHALECAWARRPCHAVAIFGVIFGVALSLAISGYQFGKSNHTVYLLDAIRHASPGLLANDWFTTQTFQYHATFGWLARGLMRVHLLEPGFLVGYLAIVALLHLGWWRLVRDLGGSVGTFLVSEVL